MKYISALICTVLLSSAPLVAMKKKDMRLPGCFFNQPIFFGKRQMPVWRVQEIAQNAGKMCSKYTFAIEVLLLLCPLEKKQIVIESDMLKNIYYEYGFCDKKGRVPLDVAAVFRVYAVAYSKNKTISIQEKIKNGKKVGKVVMEKSMMTSLTDFFEKINVSSQPSQNFVSFCRFLCHKKPLEGKLLEWGKDAGICSKDGVIFLEAAIYARSWLFPSGKW